MKKAIILILAVCLLAGIANARVYVYETGSHMIVDAGGGQSYVNVDNAEFDEEAFIPAFPIHEKLYEFPSTKTIRNVSIVELAEPVKLSLNLPDVKEGDECITESQEAYATYYEPIYTSDGTEVRIRSSPLQMDSCSENKDTLYQKISYNIEFTEPSARIIRLGYPKPLPRDAKIKFLVGFEGSPDGILKVKDYMGDTVLEQDVSGDAQIEILTEDEDLIYYRFEYYENDVLVDFKEIEEEGTNVTWGAVDFRIYMSDDPLVMPLVIELQNFGEENIDVDLAISSIYFDATSGTVMEEKVTAMPGANIYEIDVNLEDGEEMNDIEINATCIGETASVLHNTLPRLDPKVMEGKAHLPPPPGVILKEIAMNESRKRAEGGNSWAATSTAFGIILVIALFAIVGYLARMYLKSD